MLGLISLGPQGDAEAQERRAEIAPVSASRVLGAAVAEGFSDSPGPRLARIARRGYLDNGDGTYSPLSEFDDNGVPTGLLPPSPMVPLEVLKREYEIPGVLSFDKDTPQSVAQSLYEHKRDQMARADIIRRNSSAIASGMAARFAASMLGAIADPVNLAAMFVPGVREANVARMFGVGAGASALSRAGVRAGAGGTAGAAGMLALEPLNYALMQQERDDWTMAGAAANVLFGTIAGAGLHSGIGALAERVRGLPDWAPARLLNERVQASPPEVQEALSRQAVAAQAEGRPVEAAALLDLEDELRQRTLADAAMHEPFTQRIGDVDVVWPDRAHAELYDVGLRLARGEQVPEETLAALWRHFKGAIEHEQERPFASQEDIRSAAMDYAGEEIGIAEGLARVGEGASFEPLSIVSADARAPYAERAAALAREVRPRTAAEIMRDIEAARVPDQRAAESPPPPSRTGDPPPDPKPDTEPSAVAKNIAELEKEVASLDAQLKAREGETPVLADRLKEFDALVDEEARVDDALFRAAAECIVRTG